MLMYLDTLVSKEPLPLPTVLPWIPSLNSVLNVKVSSTYQLTKINALNSPLEYPIVSNTQMITHVLFVTPIITSTLMNVRQYQLRIWSPTVNIIIQINHVILAILILFCKDHSVSKPLPKTVLLLQMFLNVTLVFLNITKKREAMPILLTVFTRIFLTAVLLILKLEIVQFVKLNIILIRMEPANWLILLTDA